MEPDDDVTPALSEPVVTPRVMPVATEGIDASELFGGGPAPANAPSVPADAPPPKYTATACPVCSTRIVVTHDWIGRDVRCSDCHTRFQVPAPRETTSKAERAPNADVDFALSEPVERPRYEPITQRSVRREDLDRIEGPGTPSPADPPATVAPRRSEVDSEFAFTCPVCGTRLTADTSQVGSSVTCGDCQSRVTIPRPARKRPRLSPAVADEGEPMAAPLPVAVDASGPTATPRAVSASGHAVMESALREARERERGFTSLSKVPYARRLFGFLVASGVWGRGLGIAMGLSVIFFFVQVGVNGIVHNTGMVFLIPILIPVVAAILTPVLSFWCHTAIAILQETANGNARVEEWGDDVFVDLLLDALVVGLALTVASMPGGLTAFALTSVGVPVLAMPIAIAVSVWLLFPVGLLSQLEDGRFWSLLSAPVVRSFASHPAVWMRFYVESIGLATVGGGAAVLSMNPSIGIRVVGTILLIGASFIYARALGIAASRFSLAFTDEARRNVLVDADSSSGGVAS